MDKTEQWLVMKSVGEISLVPEGSNDQAEVLFVKAAKPSTDEQVSDDGASPIMKKFATVSAILKEAGARRQSEALMLKINSGFSALRDAVTATGGDGVLTPVLKAAMITALDNFEGVLADAAPSAVVAKSVIETMATITSSDDVTKIAQELSMDLKEMQTALTAAEDTIAKLKSDLLSTTSAKDSEIAVLKQKVIALDPASKDEDIFKGLPEAVVAKMKAQDVAIAASTAAFAKMAEDKGVSENVAFCKEKGIADFEKVGPSLYRLSIGKAKATATVDGKEVPGDVEIVKNALATKVTMAKASLKVVGQESNFRKVGQNHEAGEAGETAFEKLTAAAVEIKKAAKDPITTEAAFAKAMDANPDLYRQYMVENHPTTGAAAG